ncbi:MAG: type I-U CRISPR-associated protein Csx17 [Burkholderiales bacterium]|nr:type I-U CRISPR-associated protein Csx17 [Burkholderiales bacterium]
MIVHELGGCAPTPLAHYLKALGVLRLVAEQADPEARGWWEGERYFLATKLCQARLLAFLRGRYRPSPIFNPWGGRSGYFAGSSERASREVLETIQTSKMPRLRPFREAIETVQSVLTEITGGRKPADNEKKLRNALILALRRRVRSASADWMSAVCAAMSGEKEVEFPPIFGTGGSEGSGSYTAAYMKALDKCVIRRKCDAALPGVFFAGMNTADATWDETFGQFVPSGVASAWDMLFAFEGALVVRSAVTSTGAAESRRWMSSPFYVAPQAFASGSATQSDEVVMNKGKALPGRGEQWFPLWSKPLLYPELRQIFAEGRASVRRRRALDAWSMTRAVASLGTRAGIAEFVRYGYLQRNNQATHFAVPLGRLRVAKRCSSSASCLDDLDIDDWFVLLRKWSRDMPAIKYTSPASLKQAERRLADDLFAVVQHPDEAARWQSALVSLAGVEAVMKTGAGTRAGPIPKLRPEWVASADDGSPEFRLALSFALQSTGFTRDEGAFAPVRQHWLPLEERSRWRRFSLTGTGSQQRLAAKPEVVMQGRNGVDDAIALVQRRLIEAAQKGQRRVPLQAAPRAAAAAGDLALLMAGQVDLDRVLTLARALMALDTADWFASSVRPTPAPRGEVPDDAWLAIRLALLPWPLSDGRRIGCDPAILRRLASGDAASAVELALRRLRAAGIRGALRAGATDPATARRWAAALAFPINQSTAADFLSRIELKNTGGPK